MDNLHIDLTKNTPKIDFDATAGVLEFKGKSYPENSFEFYKPVQDWIDLYFKESTNKKTLVNFDINYLNSSSIKFYFDLFDMLETSAEGNMYIEIQWHYHADDDMTLEVGEDFKEDYEDLNMILIEKQ